MSDKLPAENCPNEVVDIQPHSGMRTIVYGVIIAIAAGISIASILRAQPFMGANDISRWCTVWSLAEQGTYKIDDIHLKPGWHTIDKVLHEDHFYSSKPPLLSTAVAGLYKGINATVGWDLEKSRKYTVSTILIIINIIPFVLMLWVFTRILNEYARSEFTRVALLILLALGTLITPFLSTLNNHSLATACTIFSLYPAMQILINKRTSGHLYAICGFSAALICCLDLPAALYSVTLFVLLLRHSPTKTLTCFSIAALIPLGAFFYTNYLATGGIKPFYAYYGTDKYEYVYRGIPSHWTNPAGIDSNADSFPVYLMHCTIGHHGIFSLTPAILLSVVSLAFVRRWKATSLSLAIGIGTLLTLVIFGFYLSRTQNYNYGGNTAGLRWLMWLIPFWIIAMIPLFDDFANRLSFRIVATILIGASIFSAAYSYTTPWRPPWLFALMQEWDWLKQYEVRPKPFERPIHTWFTTLPRQGEWIEFHIQGDLEGNPHFRLEMGENGKQSGRTIREVIVTSTRFDKSTVSRWWIDPDKYTAGKPPKDFLVWPDRKPTAEELKTIETALRGVPHPRPYQPGMNRYVKTPIQEDYFATQHAATRVVVQRTKMSPKIVHRSDIWICDDVPFGVVKIIYTVSDPTTGEIYSRRVSLATKWSDPAN